MDSELQFCKMESVLEMYGDNVAQQMNALNATKVYA
jgi:hypothetical protein